MLIVKVFINERQIDEIDIANVTPEENFFTESVHEYKIRKPWVYKKFFHVWKWGYRPLLIEVLKHLEKINPMVKPYPVWVCAECALGVLNEEEKTNLKDHLSTFHTGICGVCNKEKAVTEPRDFNYPIFDGYEIPDRGKK